MDAESGEFQDWEVLDISVDSGTVNSVDNMQVLKGIGGDSKGGIIRFDYFSLQSHTNNHLSRTEVVTDEDLVDSNMPNSFDPLTETHSGEFPSNGSGDCKNVFSIVENDESQLVHDVIESDNNSGEFWSESSKIRDLGDATEMAYLGKEMENSGDEKIQGQGKVSNEDESGTIEREKKRRMVWWKLPLDLLRYCAIRASPMWTVSVTAAVLGFVILGRRLHKMKKKGRSLQLNVSLDDKNASQLMSKAARLNEAFSIVKRVPVIRPSLPASGVTPWLVMNLR